MTLRNGTFTGGQIHLICYFSPNIGRAWNSTLQHTRLCTEWQQRSPHITSCQVSSCIQRNLEYFNVLHELSKCPKDEGRGALAHTTTNHRLSAQGATEGGGKCHAHFYGALYLITWLAIHTALTRVKLRGATVWFHDETKIRLLTNIQHCMTHIC